MRGLGEALKASLFAAAANSYRKACPTSPFIWFLHAVLPLKTKLEATAKKAFLW
jgi:hypothetical protein